MAASIGAWLAGWAQLRQFWQAVAGLISAASNNLLMEWLAPIFKSHQEPPSSNAWIAFRPSSAPIGKPTSSRVGTVNSLGLMRTRRPPNS